MKKLTRPQTEPRGAATAGHVPRRRGWTVRISPDVALAPIKTHHLKMVGILERYCRANPHAFPSNDALAKAYGCHPRRVQVILRELESIGWLTRVMIDPECPILERAGILVHRRLDLDLPVADRPPGPDDLARLGRDSGVVFRSGGCAVDSAGGCAVDSAGGCAVDSASNKDEGGSKKDEKTTTTNGGASSSSSTLSFRKEKPGSPQAEKAPACNDPPGIPAAELDALAARFTKLSGRRLPEARKKILDLHGIYHGLARANGFRFEAAWIGKALSEAEERHAAQPALRRGPVAYLMGILGNYARSGPDGDTARGKEGFDPRPILERMKLEGWTLEAIDGGKVRWVSRPDAVDWKRIKSDLREEVDSHKAELKAYVLAKAGKVPAGVARP